LLYLQAGQAQWKFMSVRTPESAEQVRELLRESAAGRRSISILGNSSKGNMAGPIQPSDISISTSGLRKILEYEPRDLTVSVEAGYPFAALQKMLAQNGQMIALDPPFSDRATVGGIVAANMSGPMRRAYGTARDLVIGMTFATLDGKLVDSGGMVVKNVAGLDMAKLMIGSFGTLAFITSINFRLHSIPEHKRTFLFAYPQLEKAIEKRNEILSSALQPIAVDLLSPSTAVRLSQKGHLLAVRAGGSESVLLRYERDLAGSEVLRRNEDTLFWKTVQEFPSEFLERQREGVILRVSTTLSDVIKLLKLTPGSFISRAGNGVTQLYFASWNAAARVWKTVQQQSWPCLVEFAPQDVREQETLWPMAETAPEQAAFVMMKSIKQMFDPQQLLNRNRLYGRI
jgi:glycolate oxidase FAD binding subunit